MFRKTLAILALITLSSCANMGMNGMSCCNKGGCCAKMMEQKSGQNPDMKSGCCCMGNGQCPFPQDTKSK